MSRFSKTYAAICGIIICYAIYMSSAFAGDGQVFMLVVAVLSGLGGYGIRKEKEGGMEPPVN